MLTLGFQHRENIQESRKVIDMVDKLKEPKVLMDRYIGYSLLSS